MKESLNEWKEKLNTGDKPNIIINCEQSTGLGDKIHITPALKELKKQNPDKNIILMIDSSPDIFKNNPNVSYILPSRTSQIRYRTNVDSYIYLYWSFYDHHQLDHIVAPYFKNIIGDYGMDKYDYSMEMFLTCKEKDYVDECINKLFNSDSKPVIAISPSFSMYNRMLPKEYWQNIVNILKNDYTICSLGSSSDFELENVIDYRGKFKVNTIPYFLDKCSYVFAVNGGFLNIAACTKKVKIIYMNVGEFPSYLFNPVRQNKLGFNCDVIEHDCPIKDKCYEGHITESIFKEQLDFNLRKYEQNEPELVKKYTAWHYCAMKESKDKYSCSYLVYNKFLKYIEENLL